MGSPSWGDERHADGPIPEVKLASATKALRRRIHDKVRKRNIFFHCNEENSAESEVGSKLAEVLDEFEYVSAGPHGHRRGLRLFTHERVYGEMVGSPFPVRATVRAQLMAPEALVQIVMLVAK
jgi:hypothetical protein